MEKRTDEIEWEAGVRSAEAGWAGVGTWRREAARIVEDLFAAVPEDEWDLLLDLRGAVLAGDDWGAALDYFLWARLRLEADHYLPFYRLRRLIGSSLRLECAAGSAGSLEEVLRRKHRSLADIRRALERDRFEGGADLEAMRGEDLRVVERAG